MNKQMTITNRSLGLRIELNADQIFPDDPGMGQPAVAIKRVGNKEYSASFDCALGESELDLGEYVLTDEEWRWFDSQERTVTEFIDGWYAEIKRETQAGKR